MSDYLFGDDPLAMTNAEVGRLTRSQREARVRNLIGQAHDILNLAIEKHITHDGRMVAAVVILFSGGNDSTVLAHLFQHIADYAAHANTTIGIEATREFVRHACREWELPLLERTPPRQVDHYRNLVLDRGFPGPAHHFKMFQRLKERALEQVQRELVTNPRRERVVFIAGRRRDESQRRTNIVESERKGSRVYASPLVNWTALDLATYRLMCAADGDPVPVNDVTGLIHMSGECLCGAFASTGERDEITYWFPEVFADIAALEAEIADRDDIPEYRKTWGWGADPAVLAASREKPSVVGLLCSACDDRFQTAFNFEEPA